MLVKIKDKMNDEMVFELDVVKKTRSQNPEVKLCDGCDFFGYFLGLDCPREKGKLLCLTTKCSAKKVINFKVRNIYHRSLDC